METKLNKIEDHIKDPETQQRAKDVMRMVTGIADAPRPRPVGWYDAVATTLEDMQATVRPQHDRSKRSLRRLRWGNRFVFFMGALNGAFAVNNLIAGRWYWWISAAASAFCLWAYLRNRRMYQDFVDDHMFWCISSAVIGQVATLMAEQLTEDHPNGS